MISRPINIIKDWHESMTYQSSHEELRCSFCREEMTLDQAEKGLLVYIGGMTDDIYHLKCHNTRTVSSNQNYHHEKTI